MLTTVLDGASPHFYSSAEVRADLIKVCKKYPQFAQHHYLGKSRQKRVIDAFIIGNGPLTVTLIAGAHADEPVGPETLRLFIRNCAHLQEADPEIFQKFRFVLIPHINPDGEIANQRWIREWPSVESYLQHVVRELPGADIEFGFPDMRPENRCVAAFLSRQPKCVLHMSLHGMAFSEGAMLLIEQSWIDRTEKLRQSFVERVAAEGLPLHDHNRSGEKGFCYIAPGFMTTPKGQAMQDYFQQRGDRETASLFHDSSMEFVRKLAGEPLCLVTELPLFLVRDQTSPQMPGVPAAYLAFRKKKPELLQRLARGESLADFKARYGLMPLPLETATRLQLNALELGLQTVEHRSD